MSITPIEVVIQLKVVVAADFVSELIFFDNADDAFDRLDLVEFLFLDFDIETQKNEPFSSLKGSKKAYQLSKADLLLLQCLVAAASLLVAACFVVVAVA
jgi:hypothetical protein